MLYSIIGMLVIIFDQIVKFMVDKGIDNYIAPVKTFIPGVISLVKVQNDGAAFSFLSGGSARIAFIIITAVFAILVVLALATNFVSGRFGRWCLVLITAGGLSNLIDRVRFGYVLDMFRIDLFDFAVFNVADIFITVFCIAFIIYILFGGEKAREEDADEFDEDDYADEYKVHRQRADANRYGEFDEESPRRRRAPDRESRPVAKRRPISETERQVSAARKRAHSEDQDEKFNEMFGNQTPKARKPAAKQAGAAVPAAQRGTAPRRKAEGSESTQAPARRRPAPTPVKEAPVKAAPAQDDPFADWEKANARVKKASAKAVEAAVQESNDAFSEYLAASGKSAPKQAPAKKAPAAEAPVAKPAVEEPVVKTPAPSAKPAAPAAPAFSDDFDLDSILNEFR